MIPLTKNLNLIVWPHSPHLGQIVDEAGKFSMKDWVVGYRLARKHGYVNPTPGDLRLTEFGKAMLKLTQ